MTRNIERKEATEMVNKQNLTTDQRKVGSVMIVGGGIGGIQAALDLAESGFKVYVVDTS